MDKPPLFDAVDTMKDILEIFVALFQNIIIEKEAIAGKIKEESLFSVDIVEYLIKKGISYRKAHDIVGKIVRDCLDKGKKISSLSNRELRRYSDKLAPDVRNILNAWASVSRKLSIGSTNPALVAKQMDKWDKKLQSGT
jgi:argininosuccinate lyase